MEKNIFEGAKFGEKFVTRNGIIGVLLYHHKDKYTLFLEFEQTLEVNEDGSYEYGDESQNDIVSKYHEEIDEEKLDELAKEAYPKMSNGYAPFERVAFKAGYKKAKLEE